MGRVLGGNSIGPVRLSGRPTSFPGGGVSWTVVDGQAITLSEDAKELILLADFNDTDIIAEL